MTIRLTARLIENISLNKMVYYPELDSHFKNKINDELNSSHYVITYSVKKQYVSIHQNLITKQI